MGPTPLSRTLLWKVQVGGLFLLGEVVGILFSPLSLRGLKKLLRDENNIRITLLVGLID